MSLSLIIRQEIFRRGYGIYVVSEIGNTFQLAKPVKFEFEDHNECICLPVEPTFWIHPEDMKSIQASITREMIGAGIESISIANAAELKATRYHLEDFRRLVFKEKGK